MAVADILYLQDSVRLICQQRRKKSTRLTPGQPRQTSLFKLIHCPALLYVHTFRRQRSETEKKEGCQKLGLMRKVSLMLEHRGAY